jgi:hypothetical protein
VPEKSTTAPASVMNCALPPVLLSVNAVKPRFLVVIVALPAVLLFSKPVDEPNWLPDVIVELPAVLVFVKMTTLELDCVLLSNVALSYRRILVTEGIRRQRLELAI